MDILNLLGSFEEQVSKEEEEITQREHRTSLYGKWVDFGLDSLMDERKRWKEQLEQQGGLKHEKIFYVKGRRIEYSSNYVNRVWLNNYVDNFVEMQKKYFEKYYSVEKTFFLGYLVYEKKILNNFVCEDIRFIKTVLEEFDIPYDDDINQEYLKCIEFDKIDSAFDNWGDMICKKIEDSYRRRLGERDSAPQLQVFVGGRGIGGFIKGYLLGTAINTGIEKISDEFKKVGDGIAGEKVKKELQEVFEEAQKHTLQLICMCSDLILPFLLGIFQVSDMGCFFDVGENHLWKQILEYSDYEYTNNLIDDLKYWERMVYLLEEYPFQRDIYIKMIDYDLDCVRELYGVAAFFGMGDDVINEAALCIARLIGKYRKKEMKEITEKEVDELYQKFQNGTYDLDAYVVNDIRWTKNSLNNYNKYKGILFKQFLAYRTGFLMKDLEQTKPEYTSKEVKRLWKNVGCGNDIYKIDAESEYKLLQYYSKLAASSIKEKQYVQFEDDLRDLTAHLKDKDTYQSDFANCLYAYLLMEFYTNESKKKDDFLRDIYLAADNGVILAKYLVAQNCNDNEEKEKLLLEIVQNNFPVIKNLKELYLKMAKENEYSGKEILAESWEKVEAYVTQS